MRIVTITLLAAAVMVMALACAQKDAETPMSKAMVYASFDDAMAAQDGRDLPIILDFYTDW